MCDNHFFALDIAKHESAAFYKINIECNKIIVQFFGQFQIRGRAGQGGAGRDRAGQGRAE